MNRRFLFPLAASVVGLVAISPVLAAGQSAPAANKSPAKATTTTMPPDDSSGSPSDSPGDSTGDPSADSGADPDAGSSTETTRRGSSTATTGSGSGSAPSRSTSECDTPEINKGPAPQVGDAPQTHEAGEAGSVDVERLSETELRIVTASANDGWTEQVSAPSGPRVTVKFTRQGESPTLIRFAASMDQKGTMIHTRVTSCG
jgi:hypothetical protein